jgi:hypothetical protein
MAKKAKTDSPDPTNSTEPTPNSAPLDEAQANPNAATGDDSDQNAAPNGEVVNENESTTAGTGPVADNVVDTNDPDEQESQPESAPEDTTSSPTTEAHLTHSGENQHKQFLQAAPMQLLTTRPMVNDNGTETHTATVPYAARVNCP